MAAEIPSPEKYLLSEYENRRIFETYIIPRHFGELSPATNPSVHFFGAQPGAGKSAIQTSIKQALIEKGGVSSVASIIGDEFRSYHPNYFSIMKESDDLAAFFTDRDSGRWVERSIAYTIQIRPHVILEGTLRNPQITLDTAILYQAAGFKQELHVVAVHGFISRLRIFQRYLDQIERTGYGRYTVPEAHDRAYYTLLQSLITLAESGLFSRITLYNATGNVLSCAAGTIENAPTLEAVLMAERSGDNLDFNSLIDTAEQLSARAKHAARLSALDDLVKLTEEIYQAGRRK